jgi:hypothetical protein
MISIVVAPDESMTLPSGPMVKISASKAALATNNTNAPGTSGKSQP